MLLHVVPTRVGMARVRRVRAEERMRSPHTRGDGPAADTALAPITS